MGKFSTCLCVAAIIITSFAFCIAVDSMQTTNGEETNSDTDVFPISMTAEHAVDEFVETVEEEPVQEEVTDEEVCEENENELIEAALLAKATKLEDCVITHYCTCSKCCGHSHGITRSGYPAIPYVTVGVDSSIIPLGSDVLIDYGDGDIQYYVAMDTGVKGKHIDICVSSHEEAIQLGVTKATVHFIPPENDT